jgi:hypothetical protein
MSKQRMGSVLPLKLQQGQTPKYKQQSTQTEPLFIAICTWTILSSNHRCSLYIASSQEHILLHNK